MIWHRRLRWLAPMTALAAVAGAAWLLWPDGTERGSVRIDPVAVAAAALLEADADGFAKVDSAWDFAFPRDYGPHTAYRTEVWDLSGQVTDANGRRYGLRMTFLRVGLAPPAQVRDSALAARNVMLANFALGPAMADRIESAQRASRAAGGLAGAESAPWRVWLEDWSLAQGAENMLELSAALEDMELTLSLVPLKAPVTDRQAGLPQAGDVGAGQDFHFFLLPRLAAAGTLRYGPDREAVRVTGSVWLERAWGAVPGIVAGVRGQTALNRFALQLDDGSELVCVHLRRRAGGGTPVTTCLAVAENGDVRVFQRRELTLVPTGGGWPSAADGTTYPLTWRLELPALGLELSLQPLLPNQEMNLGLGADRSGWSGAVTLLGRRGAERIGGIGRMDLGGYDGAAAPGT